MTKKFQLETELVQIGNRIDEKTGAVSAPVHFSTAYRHEGVGESTGYDYSRTKNPTRDILEDAIARLEGGTAGFAFSSGMAAITTLFSLFQTGDEIIASKDIYGGTYRLFEEAWREWGIHIHYLDPRNIEQVEQAMNKNTKALFIETPTNPLMQEANIAELATVAKKYNAYLIVDNTFYTPVLQQPLKEGADIVVHSATKYLGGHNDVVAGLVVAKEKSLCEKIGRFQNSMGTILAPMDAWLIMRGMKTLAVRMEKHTENARRVAEYLRSHEKVREVLYPGKGGMLSFRIENPAWVHSILKNLQLISFAESLGGVESFMTYPITQTHADMPEEVLQENGVCKRLLRMSVGIEDVHDIIDDLEQALRSADV
ncbi:methionine biosynthesis PLP-dependent protein [Aliibacillus thermotolerans]|uniref:Methionine biosynthesis PLP-dependent protein n=1 Tax=Aliibacillus thermotolerans TaxID=1834418 RepID=A0ABW0U6W5_9BACI|nr:methionine biosynthesis PLP-dependent protein [Aliibacillus thermotolerans]MDA3129484.1 methionine biosynthesis PLP-dependent protein [Aliibacillus thermotolerans]